MFTFRCRRFSCGFCENTAGFLLSWNIKEQLLNHRPELINAAESASISPGSRLSAYDPCESKQPHTRQCAGSRCATTLLPDVLNVKTDSVLEYSDAKKQKVASSQKSMWIFVKGAKEKKIDSHCFHLFNYGEKRRTL
jgi:hypothetical protein